MSELITETVFYHCPNDCKDPLFYQCGMIEASQLITETGEEIKCDTYDFIPDEGVKVKCRHCNEIATSGRKKITTTIKIEIEMDD